MSKNSQLMQIKHKVEESRAKAAAAAAANKIPSQPASPHHSSPVYTPTTQSPSPSRQYEPPPQRPIEEDQEVIVAKRRLNVEQEKLKTEKESLEAEKETLKLSRERFELQQQQKQVQKQQKEAEELILEEEKQKQKASKLEEERQKETAKGLEINKAEELLEKLNKSIFELEFTKKNMLASIQDEANRLKEKLGIEELKNQLHIHEEIRIQRQNLDLGRLLQEEQEKLVHDLDNIKALRAEIRVQETQALEKLGLVTPAAPLVDDHELNASITGDINEFTVL